MRDPLLITALGKDDAISAWPYVRGRLSEAEGLLRQSALPERVYAEWLAKRATVLIIRWEGVLRGVIVVTGPEPTETLKTKLWVWVLAVEGIAPQEMRVAINEWLAHAARSVGAESVGMTSPRKGWSRYLESLGWKPVQVEYELEVNRG